MNVYSLKLVSDFNPTYANKLLNFRTIIIRKDVRLPVQLQRAMAAEAEAAREARAKVITAEGEHKASRALKEAAEVINESPIALQLRYLQTLTAIASEKNSTIVFPVRLSNIYITVLGCLYLFMN